MQIKGIINKEGIKETMIIPLQFKKGALIVHPNIH